MSTAGAARPVPLLLLGETCRRRLVEHVERIVGDWHAAWASEGAAGATVALSERDAACPIDTGRRGVALAAFADGDLLAYVETEAEFVKALCIPGFRERPSLSFVAPQGRLAGTLTEEAVGALLTSLVGAAVPSTACTVRQIDRLALEEIGPLWRRRAFQIRVTASAAEGGRTLDLALDPRLVDALLGERPALSKPETLTARRQAVEAEQVNITISLGSAAVPWRDLVALSVGDAILLEQDLATACTVSVRGSKPVAEADLGRVENALAVQVTRVFSQERKVRR